MSSQVFTCYNSDGADIEVAVISDTGKYSAAKLRKAIKQEVDYVGDPTKITIYKWDAAKECKVGEPIVRCEDLVDKYGTGFAYELPRLQTLAPVADPGPTPNQAVDMVRFTARLPGWREKYGLRKKVTDLAGLCGALGTITPDSMSINLDLWFTSRQEAGKFLVHLRNLPEQLLLYGVPEPLDVTRVAAVAPAGLPDIAPYKHAGGSPDGESTATDSVVARKATEESAQFHRIHRGVTHQQCHIIPACILDKNKCVPWALLSAYECFNRFFDSWPPMRIFAETMPEQPLVDGRTPVSITIDTSNHSQAIQAEQRLLMHEGFGEPRAGLFSVIILVKHPDLMVKATEWRNACLHKATHLATNEPSRNQWYHLVSLDDFGLGGYKGTGRRRETKAPTTQSDGAE